MTAVGVAKVATIMLASTACTCALLAFTLPLPELFWATGSTGVFSLVCGLFWWDERTRQKETKERHLPFLRKHGFGHIPYEDLRVTEIMLSPNWTIEQIEKACNDRLKLDVTDMFCPMWEGRGCYTLTVFTLNTGLRPSGSIIQIKAFPYLQFYRANYSAQEDDRFEAWRVQVGFDAKESERQAWKAEHPQYARYEMECATGRAILYLYSVPV